MHKETSGSPVPAAFCWTRMGDESGERLAGIVRRKDLERRASGGLFVWGVGNGLGTAIRNLLDLEPHPRVLFSPIKSAAAAIDRNPSGVLIWLDYIGPDGHPAPLPDASFVTSRDSTGKGATKVSHYALFCRSDEPLETSDVGMVRFAELRNLKTQRPVGFSQVTAVVSRSFRSQGSELEYRVVLSARLTAPHFARLANPVALPSPYSERIDALAALDDPILWAAEVAEIKRQCRPASAFERPTELALQLY